MICINCEEETYSDDHLCSSCQEEANFSGMEYEE